jgi:GDP-4-dehydro-6-deoxy-D-mannose reductase
MMRTLITGVTGFAGRHLARALEAESPGSVYGTSFPLPAGPGEERARFLDLREESAVLDFLDEVRPDRIYHLAAISNVRTSWQMRSETLATNVGGTQNLLEAVRKTVPGARVLFVSSSDVYGHPGPSGEGLAEDEPLRVLNPYAFSKAAGEMLCGFYGNVEGLDVVVARPFPHTGPGQADDFVCSDWARQIVRIERRECGPVVRVGNLDVRRDISDVRDVIEAYRSLMDRGRRGEVYNICSGKTVGLREILDFLVSEAAGKPGITIEVDPGKLRKTDLPLVAGSNRKIVSETGWAPRIPMARTLKDLLDFWRGRP